MLKKILCTIALVWAAVASAAVDVNKATAAELDSVKGIGPSLSGKILDERKKSTFKDWADFISRVKGMGDKNAAKFSSEGLTVNGAGFKGDATAAAPAAKAAASVTPAAKATAPATSATPAATAAPAAPPAAVKK
jgi:competence protein ComEA